MKKFIIILFVILSCKEKDECVICKRQTVKTYESDTVSNIIQSNIYCLGGRDNGSFDMWEFKEDTLTVSITTRCENFEGL